MRLTCRFSPSHSVIFTQAVGTFLRKRMGTGREVAATVRFLAGDGAGYITGQVIHVNSGLYM